MTFYLYRITSLSTGLAYIGCTSNCAKRLGNHLSSRADWYADGHTFEVLAMAKTKESAGDAEAWLIRQHGTMWPAGNNRRRGGFSGYKGRVTTPAIREALRQAALGNKWCVGRKLSSATKAKMRQSKVALYATGHNPLRGRKKAPEHVAKMRAAAVGKPAHNKGVPMSAEQRAKLSAAKMGSVAYNKGVAWTQEVKDNIAAAKIAKRLASGKPLSAAGHYARRRKALKRQDAGLPPIPGTESYLS